MTGSEEYLRPAVVVSPDGRRVAAVDGKNNLRLWDVQTGRRIASPLKGHSGEVNGLAFSRDGRRLASTGDDKTVRLWDADNAALSDRGPKSAAGLLPSFQPVVGTTVITRRLSVSELW